MKRILCILLLSATLFAASCSPPSAPPVLDTPAQTTQPEGEEAVITPETAKELMDTATPIILDVRAPEEYNTGHIPNATLLPDYEIAQRAAEVLPDKDALILVYCRSGRRSAGAAQALRDLEYSNVKDFGGIIDWPYEIVQ